MLRRLLATVILLVPHLVATNGGRLIDGIFTEPTLQPGYNLVTTVPKGASALNVTELRHTQNYLAIRLQDGTFLLNGNYNINLSGEYKAAGTTFVYIRQSPQHLESFAALGTLQEPIDVMVLYQEPNPGIIYRYIIPGNMNVMSIKSHSRLGAAYGKTSEISVPNSVYRKSDNASSMIGDEGMPPPTSRRNRKRKFSWKPVGLTECTKSCGGGYQTKRYICVREHTQMQVPEKRCHALEKPKLVQLRCNVRPCPPKWRSGPWSECSASCGKGVRVRELECVQEVNPMLTMRVPDGACMDLKTLPVSESCETSSCEDRSRMTHAAPAPYWDVGTWSQCSTTCGPGRRTRQVTCITLGNPCIVTEMPAVHEPCDLEPCSTESLKNVVPTDPNASPWLYTEWPQECSAECGTGLLTRRTLCGAADENEPCEEDSKPLTVRTCSYNRTCSGQWFTGPWSQCSSDCGEGEQVREVVCVTALRGSLRVVLDMNCPVNKPETRISCQGPPCTSSWFMSDWSECTRSCGKGMQKREVKCLTPGGQPPESNQPQCKAEDRPISRRTCNDYPCRVIYDAHDSENPRRVVQVQNDPEIPDGKHSSNVAIPY
ncbi:thrombospondin type-1 domain-containing protein 4 isoform X2 [Orussus abietinus]|uniref:thrombospondin type-1 domain-containing protein 4 isoform X2 n=1 Tax=Orussus abietinus TaxID=222816 RepID=UPI000C716336|nr:thrombospondin type-1 domain-containing protein 4 isoform X2 [Orussus abietinus]